MGAEREPRRRVARFVLSVVLVLGVAAGCSPHPQSAVVRDPASGRPMLVAALCAGERVDAVRVRQGADGSGSVVWEVQRSGRADLRQVVLGSVPDGFSSTVGSASAIPDAGWAEVSLSGGGAAQSGSRYDAATVPDLTQGILDDLNGMATSNCDQLPFRSAWWLTIGSVALIAAGFAAAVRWARDSARRPQPRPAISSPWMYLTAVMALTAAVVIGSGSYGRQHAPGTYLLYGALLSAAALGLGLLGRLARRIRLVEWLLLLPGLVLALVACLLATVVGGPFASCGPGWTFDCTTSLVDRLVVLGCLGPGWAAAVWIAEGGWWPRFLPAHGDRHQSHEPTVDA